MKKHIVLSVMIVAGLLAAAGSSSVRAAAELSCQPCAAEFAAVEDAILNATFLGQNAGKAQVGLLDKLTQAADKAEQGKVADSIAKLEDIVATANALAAAPKPKLEDASGINAAVNATIACLSSS